MVQKDNKRWVERNGDFPHLQKSLMARIYLLKYPSLKEQENWPNIEVGEPETVKLKFYKEIHL